MREIEFWKFFFLERGKVRQTASEKFDYMLANPPFGVEWKPEKDFITKEHDEFGYGGRFGAGLPRISDGSLLFLQHMISKMKKPEDGGTRIGIVFSGSSLFTGSAGSGESEIRRWIIENDWLETIVALPDQLFYNTEIYTYIWIISNRKKLNRRGKVQLINGTSFFTKMRKSLGDKKNEILDNQRSEIVKLYGDFEESKYCRILENNEFGYTKITVERPLRLTYKINEVSLKRVKDSKQFESLAESKKRKDQSVIKKEIEEGKKIQEQIISSLSQLLEKYIDRDSFLKDFEYVFKKCGLKLSSPQKKSIISSLSERDENAEVVKNKKGVPESDSELRDNENVPLQESIDDYMKREVLPYVPDCWVDKEKSKIGYEISFNRYFYEYITPRNLTDIELELQNVESKILELLGE